jgi:hypothetical protein
MPGLERCGRLGRGQRKIHEQLAQKKHRPGIGGNQQRVLAAPAQGGAARQFGFQHRGRVAEHAVAKRANGLRDAVLQGLQALAHHLVIVAPPRIQRHHAFFRAGQARAFGGAPIAGRCAG